MDRMRACGVCDVGSIPTEGTKMIKKFLQSLFKNFIECFSIKNLRWHLLAIGLTYILVNSGFDWFYFKVTRNNFLQEISIASTLLGFLVPFILPVAIYLWGKFKKIKETGLVSLGVIQAGLISFFISVVYKAFTGRIQPEFLTNSGVDISKEFQFGFLRHGVFWGWPSSHTMVAFAMSFALITFYPKNKKVFYVALLYAFFIGLGVSISIHWFSEFVAGAILGALVGIVVGKNCNTLPI